MQLAGVIICLGYITGLLFTAVPWGGVWVIILSMLLAFLFRKRPSKPQKASRKSEHPNKTKTVSQSKTPKPIVWLMAGMFGLLATFYLQLRTPQPAVNDISKFVPSNPNSQQLFIVRGEVLSRPRLTRASKGQLWLKASQLNDVKNDDAGNAKGVAGKLYVTLPLLQATAIYPGQKIDVTGVLYKPKRPSNPGAFDFEKFLKQEGAFAGLSGRQVNIVDDKYDWGWWQVRERIVRSQVRSLDIPKGPFVSAMVIGSKAVDLPYDIRDLFIQSGLAHALAASGFQTSLILSVVLNLARRAKTATKFTLGLLSLIIFVCLAGFQPAVLRAGIMGFAALIGLLLQRKVIQLGCLLLTATLLLLFNPWWIWDLGFLLSFLSTLGLLVTAPAIIARLQWLPPAVASLIAVPIAAIVWTLPLQLYFFGVVPTYSLLLNILSTPFISVISLGGFISALAALVFPDGGSLLAGLLYYPTDWLIKLVDFFSRLPGNSYAVGRIAIWQLLIIYALILLIWFVGWWQKRWWFGLAIAFGLVLVPVFHASTLFRVTLLYAAGEPVLVVQDRGTVALINSGDEGTGRYTILPFLLQQGVNQIDWAIASDFQGDGSSSWIELLQRMPIKNLYDYPSANNLTSSLIQKEIQKSQGFYQAASIGQVINTGSITVQLLNNQLPIIQLQIQDQIWLFVGNIKSNELRQIIEKNNLPRPQVLWCANVQLLKDLVPTLQPKVAIASAGNVDTETLSVLNQSNTKLFLTGRDGAIQWTPDGQFEPFMNSTENKTSVL
jgi:competence protein ComEC